MADEVILLDFWVSPFATRVKIALAEKGVDYESREEDLSNKSTLFLKMNPVHKQVPVLIHNGKPVCESLIIVQYIDEVWNHKSPLLPCDPHQRAQARFWADFVDKKIYSGGKLMWSSTGEAQEAAKNDLIGCLKLLEGELGDKPYFGGDTFGFVDVALIPFYNFFYTTEQLGDFRTVAECPKLVAWGHRCMERECVSKSLPDHHKLSDYFLGFKKNLEIYSAGMQLMFSTGEAQETAKNDLIGYLKVLEGELGDKPYFGGETFGIMDVALVPSYSFFFAYEQCGNFNIVAECPALVAWVYWCKSIFLTSTRSMTPCWSAKRGSRLSKSLDECLIEVLYVVQFHSSLLGSPFIF
ncbi:unnamed protein product [Camellia sinensis]